MLENTKKSVGDQDDSIMSLMFIALMIANVLLLISIAIDIVAIERYTSYAVFGIGMLMFAYTWMLNKSLKMSETIFFALGIYMVFLAFIKQWNYSQLVVVGQFVLMLTTWRTVEYVGKSEKINKMIFYTYVLIGIILLGLSVSPYAYTAYVEGTSVSGELTLGFPNPNQTGIIIISTIIILSISMNNNFISKRTKSLVWIEIILLCAILYLTMARTCMVALIIYAAFYFTEKIPKLRKFNPLLGKNSNLFSILMILSPLVFLYGYLWLSDSFLKDTMILGKKLFSGRQDLYREVFADWTDKILGNLDVFKFENKHNIHLTVMINIGIVGLLIYLAYTIFSYLSFYSSCLKNNKVICCATIIVFYIIGYAEASILTSGTIYYVSLIVVMVLSNTNTYIQQEGRKIE